MKRQLLIAPVILGLLLSACGEEKEPSQTHTPPVDTVIPLSSLGAEGGASLSKEAFAEVIYREYAALAVKLPKRQNDSVVKAVIGSTKDPSNVKDALQKAMEPMRKRQDSIARQTLTTKYRISIDSVNGIIEEMKKKEGSK